MRIVLISDWFAEKMGYSENCLPKALARLGHEVHLITSNVQPYFDSPDYDTTYAPFLGPAIVATGTMDVDGYTLHRLPHGRLGGQLRLRGLRGLLALLKPDIVQTFEVFNLSTVESAIAQSSIKYRLFLESHVHASAFPPMTGFKGAARRLKWAVYARTAIAIVNGRATRCYPISQDAAALAVRVFGISASKVQVCPLGVDTELFHPRLSANDELTRSTLRSKLGYSDGNVVCVYTGRFSDAKGPQVLGQAIDRLAREGGPFRGLFVGGGTAAEVRRLGDYAGCQVHAFVPARDLPPLYWAADVGVWPKQESTSQLDAAASGLPLVLSNRITVRERVDGNGLTYEEGDPEDLAAKIQSLASGETRARLGRAGSAKIASEFSWSTIAQDRLRDYQAAIARNRGSWP